MKTVFVIGAGASKEANLPTGYELKRSIADLLDIELEFGSRQARGDHLIVQALRKYVSIRSDRVGINPYLEEVKFISTALPLSESIDNLIDQHRGNDRLELCGKLSIARSILSAENNSILNFTKNRDNATINFNELEDTWYLKFFQIITENCVIQDLKPRLESVSLIVFNYDRCIEHFLFHAFALFYKLSEQEASEMVGHINIYHPYGSVGHLPWQNRDGSTSFGGEPGAGQLLGLVDKIKTFTEGTDPSSSDIVDIRKKISHANRIVFLGFAFHKQNLELLKPEKIPPTKLSELRFYATALGISESDKYFICRHLDRLYKFGFNRESIKLVDVTSKDFFTEFRRSLSFNTNQ